MNLGQAGEDVPLARRGVHLQPHAAPRDHRHEDRRHGRRHDHGALGARDPRQRRLHVLRAWGVAHAVDARRRGLPHPRLPVRRLHGLHQQPVRRRVPRLRQPAVHVRRGVPHRHDRRAARHGPGRVPPQEPLAAGRHGDLRAQAAHLRRARVHRAGRRGDRLGGEAPRAPSRPRRRHRVRHALHEWQVPPERQRRLLRRRREGQRGRLGVADDRRDRDGHRRGDDRDGADLRRGARRSSWTTSTSSARTRRRSRPTSAPTAAA